MIDDDMARLCPTADEDHDMQLNAVGEKLVSGPSVDLLID